MNFQKIHCNFLLIFTETIKVFDMGIVLKNAALFLLTYRDTR